MKGKDSMSGVGEDTGRDPNLNMLLVSGPSIAEFDDLNQRVEEVQYKFRIMDEKMCQIETIKKDIALLEQQSQQKMNDMVTKVAESKVKHDKLLAKIEDNQSEIESQKHAISFLKERYETEQEQQLQHSAENMTNMSEIKQSVTKIRTELNGKITSIEQQIKKIQVTSKKGNQSSDEFETRVQEIELHFEKIIEQNNKFESLFARRQYVDRRFEQMKSDLKKFEELCIKHNSQILDTEIYLDRYLPCKFLNTIYQAMDFGKVFEKRAARIQFLQKMKDSFDIHRQKIHVEEQFDFSHITQSNKRMNNFKKTFYSIPNIQVPSPDSDDDYGSSSQSSDGDGDGTNSDYDDYDTESYDSEEQQDDSDGGDGRQQQQKQHRSKQRRRSSMKDRSPSPQFTYNIEKQHSAESKDSSASLQKKKRKVDYRPTDDIVYAMGYKKRPAEERPKKERKSIKRHKVEEPVVQSDQNQPPDEVQQVVDEVQNDNPEIPKEDKKRKGRGVRVKRRGKISLAKLQKRDKQQDEEEYDQEVSYKGKNRQRGGQDQDSEDEENQDDVLLKDNLDNFKYPDITLLNKEQQEKDKVSKQEKLLAEQRLTKATEKFNQQAEKPINKEGHEITPDLIPREVMTIDNRNVIPDSKFVSPKVEEDSSASTDAQQIRLKWQEKNPKQIQSNLKSKNSQLSPQPKKTVRIFEEEPKESKNKNQVKQPQFDLHGGKGATDNNQQQQHQTILKKKSDKIERSQTKQRKDMKGQSSPDYEIRKEVTMTKVSVELEKQFSYSKAMTQKLGDESMNQGKQSNNTSPAAQTRDSGKNISNFQQQSSLQNQPQVVQSMQKMISPQGGVIDNRQQIIQSPQMSAQLSEQQNQDIKEMKLQIMELGKKQVKDIKEIKDKQEKDKDSYIKKLSLMDQNLKKINQKLQSEIKTTNQKTNDEILKKIDQIQNSLLDKNKSLLDESSENFATVYKQVVQLRTDFKQEVLKAKKDLGLDNKQLSKNMDLYSISRVIDLILQYLLVHRFFDAEYAAFDMKAQKQHFAAYDQQQQQDGPLATIQIGNADSVSNIFNHRESNKLKTRRTSVSKQVTDESDRTLLQIPNSEVISENNRNHEALFSNQTPIFSMIQTPPAGLHVQMESSLSKSPIQFDIADDSLSMSERQSPQDAKLNGTRLSMQQPPLLNEDVRIRSRQVASELSKNEQITFNLNQVPNNYNQNSSEQIEKKTKGEMNFMKERQSLRAHKVIEQAWLIFQYMKNNMQRSILDEDDLTPNQLKALLIGLEGGHFSQVNQIMDQSKIFRLQNDSDASLTANSLLNYTMLIKQKKPSVEGKLVEGYVNRKMWEELHQHKDSVFDIPVSEPTHREMLTSIYSKHDLPTELSEQNQMKKHVEVQMIKNNLNQKQNQLNKLKNAMSMIEQNSHEILNRLNTPHDEQRPALGVQNYENIVQNRQKVRHQISNQRSITTTNQSILDHDQILEPVVIGLSNISDAKLTHRISDNFSVPQTQRNDDQINRNQAQSHRNSTQLQKISNMNDRAIQRVAQAHISPIIQQRGNVKDLNKMYAQKKFSFEPLSTSRNLTPSQGYSGRQDIQNQKRKSLGPSHQDLNGIQKINSQRGNMRNFFSNKNLTNSQLAKMPLHLAKDHIASDHHIRRRNVMTPNSEFLNSSSNFIEELRKRAEKLGGGARDLQIEVSTKRSKDTAKKLVLKRNELPSNRDSSKQHSPRYIEPSPWTVSGLDDKL